ncbi:MAG: ROK family protein [Clostridiales bacterium]|jgi:predicted NBD/HSP70 family sugar kinase|nr:ROK family protein [Clostridiales bacterium]
MKTVLSSDIKVQNRKAVYQYIQSKDGQTVTQSEVSRFTGLSSPTVLKIFNRCRELELIIPGGAGKVKGSGRKPGIFLFNPDAAFALGASYDGMHLILTLANLDHKIIKHEKIPVKVGIRELFDKHLLKEAKAFIKNEERPILGFGVSLPAVVDPEKKRIKFHAHPALRSMERNEDYSSEFNALSKSLALPVLMENDVNCAAIAEYRARAFSSNDLAFIMLGGGLGAGLILDGMLRRGANFSCGEIGYMVWDPNFQANRNESGFLERLVYQDPFDKNRVNLLSSEEFPPDLIKATAETLSLAIANLANSLDISHFVFGGIVSQKLGAPFLDEIKARLENLCLFKTSVSFSQLNDASSLGAASLLLDYQLDDFLSDH